MTKSEFLKSLKQALEKNNINQVTDILADYEEHFDHALATGKTEDEICKKLGTPAVIAKAYETETMVSKVKDGSTPFDIKFALNVLGRLMIIAPFNFLTLLIPGAILLALISAGWSLVIGSVSSSLAVLTIGFSAGLAGISGWLAIAIVSCSFGLFGTTIILSCLMFFITKHFILFSINYLQWNLKFILQKKDGV
jgi:uncharacterized membrane protein